MMNSPKSVADISNRAASRAGLRCTSSEVIDFDLTMRRQFVRRAMSRTMRQHPRRWRPSGRGRRVVDGCFQLFEIAVEMSEGVFLDAFGGIAEASLSARAA